VGEQVWKHGFNMASPWGESNGNEQTPKVQQHPGGLHPVPASLAPVPDFVSCLVDIVNSLARLHCVPAGLVHPITPRNTPILHGSTMTCASG
jgi:hypothetical protein